MTAQKIKFHYQGLIWELEGENLDEVLEDFKKQLDEQLIFDYQIDVTINRNTVLGIVSKEFSITFRQVYH